MIWLVDAVLAAGAAMFFVWDERRRRRARALRAYRIRELEWDTGIIAFPLEPGSPEEWLADVTGSCEITMGPGVAIPHAIQYVPLGTHTRRPGAQLGDVLPDGRVVVATRGDEATLAWPAQIEGWQDVTPDNDAWAEDA